MSTFLAISLPDGVLEQARQGQSGAQQALCVQLAGPVYTLLRRLVVQPAIAEELLQETCLAVLRNLHDCQASSFAGWVRSIAVNQALNHLRSPWHRRRLHDAEALLERQAGEPEPQHQRTDELERALNALPDQARTVVWLHDVEGYTHGEIARLYGRTPSFSKSLLARAHQQLRDVLEPEVVEVPCTLVPKI